MIETPIVIVGTGRCGSTMLHRLLALHDDVGWLSTFNDVFPTQTWLSGFSNLYRSPRLGDQAKHLPFFPKPFETYRFWEHYLPGFSRRDRPQTAADVPAEGIEPVRRAIAEVLDAQRKGRFLVKVTGWSRIGYFDRIFPDALFVWLNRESLSVVSSWVQAGWLDVTSSPGEGGWQWGEVPADYRRLWVELGGGPLLSAALKILLDLDDVRRNLVRFPERSYMVQYEDLIGDPSGELKRLLEFCQLPWTVGFERTVASKPFYDSSGKWRKYMTEEEGRSVLEFFERAEALRVPA